MGLSRLPVPSPVMEKFTESNKFTPARRKLEMHEMGRMTEEQFKMAPKKKVALILENVRSMNNVGSIFRSADCFGIHEVCISGYTPAPPHRSIEKTALGATRSVSWRRDENVGEMVGGYRRKGWKILCLEQTTRSIRLQDYRMDKDASYAIVVGNEVEGVSPNLIADCDDCLEIEHFGTKHSLNVSVSVGILLWYFCQG